MNRIFYYYQSEENISKLVDFKNKNNINNISVYFSSLHFGNDSKNKPYIHMNDDTPDNQPYIKQQMELLTSNGIEVLVMLGGAGGAYSNLFKNFSDYYKLLIEFIKKYKCIKGIDLDVEEYTKLSDLNKLINCIKKDLGKNFIISMAPVADALMYNSPGLGGFSYKKLIQSDTGKLVDWFNVQAYGNYSYDTFKSIITNGYLANKITFGMLGDEYTNNTFPKNTVIDIYKNYPNLKGFILWEYSDSKIEPLFWGKQISNIINI